MPTTLRESTPIARKDHICDYCFGKIEKGSKYRRTTLIYDDKPYDWKEHQECGDITQLLDMWDWVDFEGLSPEQFQEAVWEYVREKHYDEEIDDTAKEWQNLTTHEAVLKILNEDFKDKVK